MLIYSEAQIVEALRYYRLAYGPATLGEAREAGRAPARSLEWQRALAFARGWLR